MNINRNSWHYAWYNKTYTLFDGWPPSQTNLCQYVQRILGISLLCLVIGVSLLTAVGYGVFCVGLIEWSLWHHPVAAVIVHACIALLVGGLYFKFFKTVFQSEGAQVIRSYLSAKKNRFCPTVTFSDDPTSQE
jgi:hypothetical protein